MNNLSSAWACLKKSLFSQRKLVYIPVSQGEGLAYVFPPELTLEQKIKVCLWRDGPQSLDYLMLSVGEPPEAFQKATELLVKKGEVIQGAQTEMALYDLPDRRGLSLLEFVRLRRQALQP